MSFLNQLKSQAKALQSQHNQLQSHVEESAAQVGGLARQLNVIVPAAPAFRLDGKTPWPAMKLIDFRVDARKKTLRSREAFDYITETRGNVVVTADHAKGQLAFRLMNASGFGIVNAALVADKVKGDGLSRSSSFRNPSDSFDHG